MKYYFFLLFLFISLFFSAPTLLQAVSFDIPETTALPSYAYNYNFTFTNLTNTSINLTLAIIEEQPPKAEIEEHPPTEFKYETYTGKVIGKFVIPKGETQSQSITFSNSEMEKASLVVYVEENDSYYESSNYFKLDLSKSKDFAFNVYSVYVESTENYLVKLPAIHIMTTKVKAVKQ